MTNDALSMLVRFVQIVNRKKETLPAVKKPTKKVSPDSFCRNIRR